MIKISDGVEKFKMLANYKSTYLLFFSAVIFITTIIDKYYLKGQINFYIHTPILYTMIFFLNLTVIKREWNRIQKGRDLLINTLSLKVILQTAIFLIPLVVAILLKNKLNEFIINQNVLSLEYDQLKLVMDLKFLAKSLILYSGTFVVGIIATIISTKETKVQILRTNKNLYPLLISLILFFVIIKLFFVFAYSGNYQDDWHHIVAGKDFFETGRFSIINQYFGSNGYLRGTYMTVLTNLFMLIGGRSVDIAQLAPGLIGFLNFCLLLRFAKRLFKTKLSLIAFSIFYTISPLVIFNHLFIRMYVFFELFFLIIIILSIYIYINLSSKKFISASIGLILLLILNIFIWEYTRDKSSIIFPAYSLLGIAFSVYKTNFLNSSIQRLLKLFKTNISFTSLLILLLVPLVLLILKFFPFDLFSDIVNSNTNEGSSRSSLIVLLVYSYSSIILFVFLAFATKHKYSVPKQLFITFGFSSLILHLLLPDTYQVIRGFNYTWGILFLISVMMIEDLVEYFALIIKRPMFLFFAYVLLILTILIPILRNYHSSFLTVGPRITGEVAYYEFEDTFKSLQTKFADKTLIESTYNVIPDMHYQLPAKYVLNLYGTLEKHYFPPAIHEITTISEVESLRIKSDVCIVLRDFSYKNLVKDDFINYLINNYSKRMKTIGYEVWCEKDFITKSL